MVKTGIEITLILLLLPYIATSTYLSSTPNHNHLRGRKMLTGADPELERYWGNNTCSSSDIELNQGRSSTLPSGIPSYSVEILNACSWGCAIANIHLSCEWFSSTGLINPTILQRLKFNDCIVNEGKPLLAGSSISFIYSNTRRYSLSVSSVTCV